MPTVSSIVRQTDMTAQLSKKLFKLDMAAAEDSLLVGAPLKTSANFLQSDFGGQPALTTMVENYTEEKSAFHSDLQSAMENLKKSSEQVQNAVQSEGENVEETSEAETPETNSNLSTLKEFSKNNVPPHEKSIFGHAEIRNDKPRPMSQFKEEIPKVEDNFEKFAENYLVAEKDDEQQKISSDSENQDDRLTSIKNFVRDYNSAVSYLNEKSVSSLNKNENLTQSLNEIGISVNSSGALSVDEKTLTDALQKNSEKISSVLGDDGLTGKLEKEVDKLNFPSIFDYANKKASNLSEFLYSARTPKIAAYNQTHAGNFINAFT